MGFVLSTVLEIVRVTTSSGLVFGAQAASPPPVVVDIHYDAPAECPSEAWFLSDVLARIPRARRAAPGENARPFDVTVIVDGDTRRASLEFEDAEGQRVRRELEAGDCAEVVAGIAVVTAVAIDPRLAELDRAEPEPKKSEPSPERPPE